ncbi:hypothetical protein Hanom_Chr08g00753311 [Helianthus anomalus]
MTSCSLMYPEESLYRTTRFNYPNNPDPLVTLLVVTSYLTCNLNSNNSLELLTATGPSPALHKPTYKPTNVNTSPHHVKHKTNHY